MQIGQTHVLTVTRSASPGLYLAAGDLGEVLLPRKFCSEEIGEGDSITVFLYLDSDSRPIATTQRAKAQVGEFAYLQAIANTDYGTFLDWGLDKDLLVPFAEQHRPMTVGHSYLVHVHISKADGRIIASSKIDKFLDDERPHNYQPQQRVNLMIANSTDLGFKAIINHSHWGVLYKNEVRERLSFGQNKVGFIKHLRPDGKIDLSLDGGQETRDQHSERLLDYLRRNQGFCPVHDKSDPALIQDIFGMSKKAFKKTVGGLYKKRIISIEADGLRLLDDSKAL